MLSGTELHQALKAGLWEALADGSDRAAMRATCRDARDAADELRNTAVLPVGPDTWDSGGVVATYHRKLGAVRSVHVVYSGEEDEARAVHFMEAYSTALGAPLPAAACSITMPLAWELPTPLAAALLQRVVPHVERLDMALGRYDNVEQLLQALEPCARLCSLRLLPPHASGADEGLDFEERDLLIRFGDNPGALEALCRLPCLHTLSGPLAMDAPHLQRLCDALPSLTTLGFKWLDLNEAPDACISGRLHTLAAWCNSAGHESQPWAPSQRARVACFVTSACALLTALPAVQHLDALVLASMAPSTRDVSAIRAATQRFAACAERFAACAERWTWDVGHHREELQALQGMPQGSLASLKHLSVFVHWAPADVAPLLGGLTSVAPNITTLVLRCNIGTYPTEALAAMMQPLRRAAHLHAIWLSDANYDRDVNYKRPPAARQAALLEGVVRCLAQPGAAAPGAESGDEYCRALRHVLLNKAKPKALASCKAALARSGIFVSVDGWKIA